MNKTDINDVFLRFEDEAMLMTIHSDSENAEILLEQYRMAVVKERWFSGSGFFTEFTISHGVCKLQDKNKAPIGTVYGTINDLETCVGFLLFFENGYISTLECHQYDDAEFPEEITVYKLTYTPNEASV